MHVVNRAYGGNDVDTTCRLCSSNSGIMVLNIFDNEGRRRRVSSLIKDCLPVQIYENDPLPKVICHNCLHKLEVFHEFQKECLKSDETLRTLRSGASHSSFSTFRDTTQEYAEKSAYTSQEYIEKPPYLAFRRPSQDFTDEPAPKNVPDFTAELHPVLLEQLQQQPQTSAASEQHTEENTDTRRQSFECVEAPLEVVMVKQEPEEVKNPLPEEDTRWDSSNAVEDDNEMETEQTLSEMLQSEDDVKPEIFGGIDLPIISDMNIDKKLGVKERMKRKRDLIKEARLSGNKYVNYKGKEVPAKSCGEPCGIQMEMDGNSTMIDIENMDSIPEEIVKEADQAEGLLIPGKSKNVYEKEYEKFCAWRKEKHVSTTNEKILLAYFSELSKICRPSTLWCVYSKVKCMLKVKENVNISSFGKVFDFLKKCSVGYKPKKSNVLSRSEIDRFIKEAPDNRYLLMKVVLAFGIFGACRRHELHDLCVDDVEVEGRILVVHIRDTKNYKPRTFTIVPDGGPVNCVELFEKYVALRPKNAQCKNLFLYYRDGKCSCQPVGVNSFGKFPMEVAKFLKLPNASNYTGHCFRQSSATILANTGASITEVRSLAEWKSVSVAESYIEESIESKIRK